MVRDVEFYRLHAQRLAESARKLMAQPAGLDSHDWGLLVDHVIAADEALCAARQLDPSIEVPVLDEAIEEVRDITANFTRPDFLVSTKAHRRRRPKLFNPRR